MKPNTTDIKFENDNTKKYRSVYRDEKANLLKSIKDPLLKERVRLGIPKDLNIKRKSLKL